MYAAIAVLAFVAAVCAQDPPRPNIPEDFYAETNSELHGQQVLYGQGRWAIDSTQNVGVSNHEFQTPDHHDTFYVYDLDRYDLGYHYSINSFNRSFCNETQVTGNMPPAWAWVALASYAGKHYHGDRYLDLWNYTTAGITLAVGVQPPYYSYPQIYIQQNGNDFLFMEFYRFDNGTDFNHSIFDVPSECASTEPKVHLKVSPPKATPPRPNISEVFEADTAVEVERNGTYLNGNGFLASDQPNNKFVENYDLQPEHGYPFHYLELWRYDLGEIYTLDSQNFSDCGKHNVSGSMPPFWNWIAAATYEGQRYVRNLGLLDIWSFLSSGGVNITLAVDDHEPNYPVFLSVETSTTAVRREFQRFNPYTPNPDDFNVPTPCQ